MEGRTLSRTTGSVVLQMNALELIARYSMNSGRATSVLSSLHEFRENEVEQVGNKQWNWKYLRGQFDQKDLEGLYRRYDDKLKESLINIYICLLILFSTVHIAVVVYTTYVELFEWHPTYLSIAMYVLRVLIPVLCLWRKIYEPLKKKWFWIPICVTFIITADLVITDISVAIYSSIIHDIALRPAYATMVLLSVYIFLPMRNNYLAIILGAIVTLVYVLVLAFFTYVNDPDKTVVLVSDVVYLAGVNLMGVYFRLMNEIVTRRSFLDRRACVESTLRLKFVKDQEERLMLSILPEHIVSKVRQDIRAMFLKIQSQSISHSMKSLNQLYVEEHFNVSILYADVVNYTMISTTLPPMRMVELLNELFGRFDEASEEHDVLRIKFLGDCYYCVSGIPKPNPQHAKSCVDLGLEMIHIIKDVREKRSLNMDMRIGVHSGRILSGLIGTRKWQYDIWSKDVTIASKMESTGKAGKVHITKETLELLLDFAREYIIEPNFESQNDPFIMKNKLETYLLSRPIRGPIEYKPFRRASIGINKIIKKNSPRQRSDSRCSANFRRTTSFMDENLVEYQQMLKAADAQMAKEIESLGKEQLRKKKLLSRCSLMHNSMELEKKYLLLPDPLFKYYILCCFIIIQLIFIINGLTTTWFSGFQWYTWMIFAFVVTALVIMQPLTWFQFLWVKYKGIEEPHNSFLRKIYDSSAKIIKSAYLRTILYIVISIGLAACAVVTVIGCAQLTIEDKEQNNLSNCVSSWHITHCWGLALLLNFLFSRVFFLFKWLIAGAMTIFYLWVVWETKTFLFAFDTTWNFGLDPRVSHTLSVAFITITLYFVDRNTEFRNRLDHLWQIQLREEQEEAETMLNVNSMLLENILPAHVVRLYLNINRSIDELYYEKYDNVAVMFASLTDYKLGVEDDSDLGEKYMLRIMDEVISDFDKLLLMGTSQNKVEKIKMAGWTYMAACGLDPNRRSSFDSNSVSSVGDKRQTTQDVKTIVMTMVQFAAAMIMQLHNFNKGSFQRFEGMNLRVGISNGEVAAGVVGSLKPLYDIWGHAVNMASRMDSTGETGRIQVTENTAIILEECGIVTRYRGKTFVKGAGYIRTYFVPLNENYELIKKEDSLAYFRTQDRARYYSVRDEMFAKELDEELGIQTPEMVLKNDPLLNPETDNEGFIAQFKKSPQIVDTSFTIRDPSADDDQSSVSSGDTQEVDICETRC